MSTNHITPRHLAFILDGNRRWSVEQGMNKIQGHQYGLENVHRILEHCGNIGVCEVSLYVFSTENWNRSQLEVEALLALFRKFIVTDKDRLLEHRVRVRFVGDLSRFDVDLQERMREIEEITSEYSDRSIYVCLSYGGRLELVQAAERMANTGETYNEKNFEKYLWTSEMSDVDLLIRTGGNHRLSNFLLWRAAYAELYFTSTLWPDFTPSELDEIIEWYGRNIQINKGR